MAIAGGLVWMEMELAVIEGRIPARALGLVLEWAAEHQDELALDWRRASSGETVVGIAPLA